MTSARLGSSFLDNPGLNSRCFYRVETLEEVFSETRGHPVTIENHQPSGITGDDFREVSLWQLLIWASPPLSEDAIVYLESISRWFSRRPLIVRAFVSRSSRLFTTKNIRTSFGQKPKNRDR